MSWLLPLSGSGLPPFFLSATVTLLLARSLKACTQPSRPQDPLVLWVLGPACVARPDSWVLAGNLSQLKSQTLSENLSIPTHACWLRTACTSGSAVPKIPLLLGICPSDCLDSGLDGRGEVHLPPVSTLHRTLTAARSPCLCSLPPLRFDLPAKRILLQDDTHAPPLTPVCCDLTTPWHLGTLLLPTPDNQHSAILPCEVPQLMIPPIHPGLLMLFFLTHKKSPQAVGGVSPISLLFLVTLTESEVLSYYSLGETRTCRSVLS